MVDLHTFWNELDALPTEETPLTAAESDRLADAAHADDPERLSRHLDERHGVEAEVMRARPGPIEHLAGVLSDVQA